MNDLFPWYIRGITVEVKEIFIHRWKKCIFSIFRLYNYGWQKITCYVIEIPVKKPPLQLYRTNPQFQVKVIFWFGLWWISVGIEIQMSEFFPPHSINSLYYKQRFIADKLILNLLYLVKPPTNKHTKHFNREKVKESVKYSKKKYMHMIWR